MRFFNNRNVAITVMAALVTIMGLGAIYGLSANAKVNDYADGNAWIESISITRLPVNATDDKYVDTPSGSHISAYDDTRLQADFSIPRGTLSDSTNHIGFRLSGLTLSQLNALTNAASDVGTAKVEKEADGSYYAIATMNDDAVSENESADISGTLTLTVNPALALPGNAKHDVSIGDESTTLYVDRAKPTVNMEPVGDPATCMSSEGTTIDCYNWRVTIRNDGSAPLKDVSLYACLLDDLKTTPTNICESENWAKTTFTDSDGKQVDASKVTIDAGGTLTLNLLTTGFARTEKAVNYVGLSADASVIDGTTGSIGADSDQFFTGAHAEQPNPSYVKAPNLEVKLQGIEMRDGIARWQLTITNNGTADADASLNISGENVSMSTSQLSELADEVGGTVSEGSVNMHVSMGASENYSFSTDVSDATKDATAVATLTWDASKTTSSAMLKATGTTDAEQADEPTTIDEAPKSTTDDATGRVGAAAAETVVNPDGSISNPQAINIHNETVLDASNCYYLHPEDASTNPCIQYENKYCFYELNREDMKPIPDNYFVAYGNANKYGYSDNSTGVRMSCISDSGKTVKSEIEKWRGQPEDIGFRAQGPMRKYHLSSLTGPVGGEYLFYCKGTGYFWDLAIPNNTGCFTKDGATWNDALIFDNQGMVSAVLFEPRYVIVRWFLTDITKNQMIEKDGVKQPESLLEGSEWDVYDADSKKLFTHVIDNGENDVCDAKYWNVNDGKGCIAVKVPIEGMQAESGHYPNYGIHQTKTPEKYNIINPNLDIGFTINNVNEGFYGWMNVNSTTASYIVNDYPQTIVISNAKADSLKDMPETGFRTSAVTLMAMAVLTAASLILMRKSKQ